MTIYPLPKEVRHLIHARNQLRSRYEMLGLNFTLDGNLVGDLGEAIAAELFDLRLADKRGQKAIDAYTRQAEPKTVQIKATGRGQSLIFTHTELPADYLIGLHLRYEQEQVEVAYNGPYDLGMFGLDRFWSGQKSRPLNLFRRLNLTVEERNRLPIASKQDSPSGCTSDRLPWSIVG